MKKAVLILMSLLAVLTIAMSVPAQSCALCSDCKALNACYDRCKELFPETNTRTGCFAGCIIGCWIAADA